jgi:hypothetical protein
MANAQDFIPKMSVDKFPVISLTLQFRVLAELKVIVTQLSEMITLNKPGGEIDAAYPKCLGATQQFYEGMSKEIYQDLMVQAYAKFGE